MIIEFTGPSGCGKTTTIRAFRDFLLERGIFPIVIAEGASANQFQVDECITNISKHGICTDIAVFFPALSFFLVNIRFTFFIIKNVIRLSGGVNIRIAVLRSVWRKMGILSYFKRSRYRPLVVLFDEGPVHSAHNILVDANFDVEIVEVEKFFKLTPFADMTVIQSATESTLIKRLYKRGDWSPRVCDEEELNRFIGNAAKLYKILSKKLLRSTDKALVIDSTSLKPSEFVEQLFPFIEGTKNK